MEVSNQLRASAALPLGTLDALNRKLGEPQSRCGRGCEEKNSQNPSGINPRTPLVYPVG